MKRFNINVLKKHTLLYWSIVAIVIFLALHLLAPLVPNLEEIMINGVTAITFILFIIYTLKAISIFLKMLPFILLLPLLLIIALIVSRKTKKREMIGGQ